MANQIDIAETDFLPCVLRSRPTRVQNPTNPQAFRHIPAFCFVFTSPNSSGVFTETIRGNTNVTANKGTYLFYGLP